MTLFVVRHAHAGDRTAWTGDDGRRPLSAIGRRQAEALVDVHAGHDIGRILSSPARRCRDTVTPLAAARDIDLVDEDALAEGAPFALTDGLLGRVGNGNTLLCSHGDVIGRLVDVMYRSGVIPAAVESPKGSTWVLDSWPEPRRAHLLAPPVRS